MAHFQNNLRQGLELKIEIEVNVYPYSFGSAVLKELKTSIQNSFGSYFNVSLIHQSWEQLALDKVRENYFGMIFYEYADWVNSQNTALRQKPLRDTCLYVPRLYFGNKPDPAIVEEYKKNGFDTFEQNRKALEPVLPIQYLPVAFFCLNTPQNLDEYTDPI